MQQKLQILFTSACCKKNPEVDLAEEFLKHRILVYSGVCYETIQKNGCRFRVPAAEDMPAVMEALKAIDAID